MEDCVEAATETTHYIRDLMHALTLCIDESNNHHLISSAYRQVLTMLVSVMDAMSKVSIR